MCCEHKGHHDGDCDCGCGGYSHFGPAFWSQEEKIAWLEEVLKDLQGQADAVKERIAALKGDE